MQNESSTRRGVGGLCSGHAPKQHKALNAHINTHAQTHTHMDMDMDMDMDNMEVEMCVCIIFT